MTPDRRRFGHCVRGVHHEVHEGLLQEHLIAVDDAPIRRQIDPRLDMPRAQVVRDKGKGLIDDGVQIDRFPVQLSALSIVRWRSMICVARTPWAWVSDRISPIVSDVARLAVTIICSAASARFLFADSDSTELDLIRTHQLERQHQLSQEITISHQQPGLTWVGGMFLFSESDHQSLWVDQPAAQSERRLDPRVAATSRAVFGQATFGLMSRLSATAGVRYTHEGKDIDNAGGLYGFEAPYAPIPGSVYGYSDSIANSAWTPKIGLEMKLPNSALVYLSATRGFKSGGFNPSSTAPGRGYAPEWVWSYEGGLKGALRGGRSRFSTSGFFMDYTNLQVQTPIGIGVFDIRNAAAATIRGVEVEGTSLIGHGIEAGGHVTWLDATYDR